MNKFLCCLLLTCSLFSCTKTEISLLKPSIKLKQEAGFIYKDTSLKAGSQYKLGIIALSESGENLTNIYIESNGNRIFDKGYNQAEIVENLTFVKNSEELEILNIIIRNKSRQADTLTLNIAREQSSFLPIKRLDNVIVGAQGNSGIGNYFSISDGKTYTQPEAFLNQQMIDLIYYYDNSGDANTLASPGANLSGIVSGSDSPEFWTIKRTTRFSRLPLIIDDKQFSESLNDSLIIANLFSDGGRKAKQLQNGQFYGFITEENKPCILKIVTVNGQNEGSVEISLIIQN